MSPPLTDAAVAAAPPRSPWRRWRLPLPVALVLPAQLTVLAVVLLPTLLVIWLSVTDWQPTSGAPWYAAEFIGALNFEDLYHDERFLAALARTLAVVAICVAAEFLIALGLALLFLEQWPWRRLAVSVLILPMMIVPVDAANAFFMLFNDHGPVNHLLSLLFGRPVTYAWLADPDWAMVPIILAEIWQWTPLMFLLVLSGLTNLPRNQVRAAVALGASPARLLFRVMLPLAAPVFVLALILRSIETFKIFDPVYILTRGGPGASTESISMFMYNGAFVYFRIGYIAAAALIVLVAVILFCIPLDRLRRRHED
jgi:multiple sugar transport system permease protein